MFKHWRKREANDRGDGVLVFTIIMLPLLFICFGFGLDMTKNSYIKSSLNTMAQNAADVAIQKIDSRGGLTSTSAVAFVEEYKDQRGLTGGYDGAVSAESNTFMGGGACKTAEIDGVTRSLPYLKFSYDTDRGNGTTARTSNFTWQNNSFSTVTLDPNVKYRAFNATIYDAAPNYILGLSGLPCQLFEVETSGVAFGANEDLTPLAPAPAGR
jgi:hypothetical protein